MRSLASYLALLVLLAAPAPAASEPLPPEDRLQFADGLYARGLYELAAKEYAGFLAQFEAHAQSDVAHFRLGECLRQTGDLAGAEKEYRIVFTRYPDSRFRLKAGFKRADLFLQRGQYQEAAELFDAVLAANPPADIAPGARYFAGVAYAGLGKRAEAEAAFRALLDGQEDSEFHGYALLKLGELCAAAPEKADEAAGFYRRAAEEPGSDRVRAEALFQMGGLQYRRGAYAGSLDAYRLLLASFPGDARGAEARLPAAWAAHNSGLYVEAIELAQAAAAAAGADPAAAGEWLYLRANCERQLMKHDDALRTYAELLAKDPAGLFANAARYERALTAYKAGKFADAAAMAQEIPLTDNLRKDAYWLLAESFAAMGKSDSAIQYYRLLAKEFPDSDVYRDACYRLAHHLQAKGEYAEASQYYLAVADRFPDHDLAPKALYGSAYALTKAARYEDAVRDWTRLARTYAGHELREEALYQKAMGEVRLGRKPDAAESLRSLLKDYPASGYAADAHYWQGVLLKEAGSLQDAAESLRLCLKAEPRKELAREAAFCLASVLQASGQAGEAAALFQSLVDSPLKDRFSPGLLEWMSTQHYDKGDYTNAVAAARLMVESAPDAAWRQTGWCLAGRGLLASGDAAGAKAAFEASLAADAATPFAPEASLRLGEIALGAGDAAGATARFSRAAELAVDETLLGVRARAYAGLARSAKAGGDLDSAARYFMSVAVLFEDRDLVPECLYEAAQAYLQLANGGAAQKAVEELKARYPDSEWTKRAGVP